VDAGPGNQSVNYAAVDGYSVTQELRLNGKLTDFEWTAGLYYLRIDSRSKNGLKFPVGSVVPGAPFDLGSDARLITDSYSAFGQIEYRFAPRWNFILGARVIQEEKNYNFAQNIYGTQDSRQIHVGTPLSIGPLPGGRPFLDQRGQTLWAGKVQIEYKPNRDLLLFAGVNRGVKAGSYNAQLAGGLPTPPAFIPYGPETLLSYEGGFKWSFLDGRGRLNASGYYYDYSNYQSFLFTGVSGVVINANARTYGGEAEFAISPVRGLDLAFNVSAFDATVLNVPLRVGGPIRRDVKPTYAPELQTNSIVRYQFDALGGKIAVAFDGQTSSGFYYNLRNFSSDRFDPFLIANFGLSWSNDRVRLGFDVRNATDERAGVQGFNLAGLCGCNEVSYRLPRQFILSARYTY
jgi:iron complex outermembrane receptor protein